MIQMAAGKNLCESSLVAFKFLSGAVPLIQKQTNGQIETPLTFGKPK